MIILLTGGGGYIGTHCIYPLIRAGHKVIVFDNFSSSHRKQIDDIVISLSSSDLVTIYEGDLNNKEDCEQVFKQYAIDQVIHLASFSQVQESITNPGRYYLNNVLGTINLLESMRNHNVRSMVFSSSAQVYGEPIYVPIDEEHPKNPVNPYGKTKLMIETILNDYSRSYSIRCVCLRYFNVVGADEQCRCGEWHEPETHIIPKIIKSSLCKNGPFIIFGNDYPTRDGTCVRDYIDVNDVADAHLLALKYLLNGGNTTSINLGTKNGYTVKEIINVCKKVLNQNIICKYEPRRLGDPSTLIADFTKANTILGWTPTRPLEKSIRTAYEWEISRLNDL